MQMRRRRATIRITHQAVTALLGLGLLTCCACQTSGLSWFGRTADSPADEPVSSDTSELPDADTGFTLVRSNIGAGQAAGGQSIHQLAVLHVLIPRASVARMGDVWKFLREDVADADSLLRLRRNGFRVGIGHTQWWAPIKAAMDAIDGHRVSYATPVRMPVGVPLTLELDNEPHTQTIFWMDENGLLTGSTWPDSRNALRVVYGPSAEDPSRTLLRATPEVQQKQDGWEWVRTQAGLWQVPKQNAEQFAAAGFELSLAEGEFALIAPSDRAEVKGMLGRAFLSSTIEQADYYSYVFLRPETVHVRQSD